MASFRTYDEKSWNNNPRWLFDAFRNCAWDIAFGTDEAAPEKTQRFLDEMRRLQNPDRINLTLSNGDIFTTDAPLKALAPLLLAMIHEATELLNVFGNDYMDATQEQMAQIIVRAVCDNIHKQALAEFLHREGQLSDAQYYATSAAITAQMDWIGINGLERLLKAKPELEERLKENTDTIIIEELYPLGMQKFSHQRGKYYLQGLKDLEGPTFINESAEKAAVRKQSRREILQNDAMGPTYNAALKEKSSAFSKVTAGWDNHILLSNRELFNVMNNHHPALQTHRGYSLYLINNYLGAHNPGLAEFFKSAGINPENAFIRARQIGVRRRIAGDYEPIFPPGTNVFDSYSKSGSNPFNVDQSTIEQTAETEASAQLPVTLLKEPAPPAAAAEPTNNDSSHKDSSPKPQPAPHGKKHKDFVTAGKIGVTTVFGIGLADGLYNIFKKEKDPEHESSKSKKFIRAAEIAAAIAGIVLVWQSKTVHGWLNNVFNRAQQSA